MIIIRTLLLFLLTTVSAHAAGSCKSGSADTLVDKLVQNSPFKGSWSQNNSNKGPISFSVYNVSGIPYVSWSVIDADGQVSGTTEVLIAILSRNKFSFNGYWGDVNLKVKSNCKLVGSQATANNEQLKLFLYPTNNPKSLTAQPPTLFKSSNAFGDYLVGNYFEGQWKRNMAPEKTRFSFSRGADGTLNSVYFHTIQEDGFVTMSAKNVKILSPSRVRIDLPEENDHKWDWVQLELQSDGSLSGIQTFDENYVLVVDLAPK